MIPVRNQFKNSAIAMVLLVLLTAFIVTLPVFYVGTLYAQSLSGTTFPPPMFYTLRNEPSYAVTIPFSSASKPPFEPAETSIPAGMTVIWFNDDTGLHSVTTLTNSTYSPPQSIDSGPIPPNGGSFIYTFSKLGTYYYYNQFDPSIHGQINVGAGIETGKNMNMMVGGNAIPFNAKRVVLSFVPKTVSIPPTIALTYNVTLLNSLGKPIYSHKYDSADGVLDIELVPTHKSQNGTEFTTWGPDFHSQEAIRSTGTFHIKGPVLVENSQYGIRVAIISKDNSILSNPIADTFALPPKVSQSR